MAGTKKPFAPSNKIKESRTGIVVASAAKNSHLIETKQQQIVDSTSQIFFEKGFHPTTVRMVAEASGMSIGQLYHYVSSKDDVLYLVHKSIYEGLHKHLVNSGVKEIMDPLERFIAALRHSVEFLRQNKKLVQFAYSESKYLRKRHLSIVLEMFMQNVVGFWRQLLSELNEKKPLNVDLDFAASFIAHQTVFLALSGWTLRDKPVEESIDQSIHFILRGFGLSTDFQ